MWPLADNRRLQRALESWQPSYLRWWESCGPEGTQAYDVYLRTAISVESDGWAHFGYVKMPDYRWGIFPGQAAGGNAVSPLATTWANRSGRKIPGEYRSLLRRLVVTQGDTEPASVEQQRHLGHTCPSLYDLRNLFSDQCGRGASSVGHGPISCTPILVGMAAKKPR